MATRFHDLRASHPDGTTTAATVFVPDHMNDRPVVLFGFPGAGYCRHYYEIEHPTLEGPGQAVYHAERGYIFVACDHLCVGDSTTPDDPFSLTFETVAEANATTVHHVVERLRQGTVAPDLAPVEPETLIGIGQSMGAVC